ncbi:unnamed protein product [Rotaria sp. Silwood2]|nr:unnamed protein product [Rotaria sp. Silwood2]CAF3913078.1 unnamed protein product [Rotaria sp. Silwood2]
MVLCCSSAIDSSEARCDLFGIIDVHNSTWFEHSTSYAKPLSYNDLTKDEIFLDNLIVFFLSVDCRHFDDKRALSLSSDEDLIQFYAYVFYYYYCHRSILTTTCCLLIFWVF